LINVLLLSGCSSIRKDILSFARQHHYHVGFYLLDPTTGKALIDINGDKYFTPASNTKILTFYSALSVLGDSIQALKYEESDSVLYIWGTGDPVFLNDIFTDTVVIHRLREADSLVLSTSAFHEKYFGPGWSWDDYNYSYSPERSGFPIYGNMVKFSMDSITKELTVRPRYFVDSVRFMEGEQFEVVREQSRNLFYVTLGECKTCTLYRPFKTSWNTTRQLLADTLHIPIGFTDRALPDSALRLYSLPTDTVLKEMMRASDNFVAEQLLMQIGMKVSDTLNSENAIDYMHNILDRQLPDSLIWVDGSGLSRYNLTTPRNVVRLWQILIQTIGVDRIKKLVSVGGVAGTIKNWYAMDQPYIYGKTGTLSNNHNLSGLLFTRSGKMLIFAYMNNNYPFTSADVKVGMENILRNVYEHY